MLDLGMLETPSRLAKQQLPHEILQDAGTSTASFSLPQVQDVCPVVASKAFTKVFRDFYMWWYRLTLSRGKWSSVSSQRMEPLPSASFLKVVSLLRWTPEPAWAHTFVSFCADLSPALCRVPSDPLSATNERLLTDFSGAYSIPDCEQGDRDKSIPFGNHGRRCC